MNHKLVCALLLGMVAYQNVQAQIQETAYTLWLGVGMLNSSYIGDFTYKESNYLRVSPGICVSAQFEGISNLQGQLAFGFGRFTEQNDRFHLNSTEEYEPTNFVETKYQYLDVLFKYRFFKKHNFQPYLAAGAGILTFNPRDQYNYSLVSNIYSRPTQNSYNTVVPSVPVSVGFRVKCSRILQMELAYSYRFTTTDYLDNMADNQTGIKNGNDAIQALTLGVCLGFQTKIQKTLNRPHINPINPNGGPIFQPKNKKQGINP